MRKLLNTLYVTNPEAVVRKKDEAIAVMIDGKVSMSVPFQILENIVLFGHVGCTAAVLGSCAERGIGVTLLGEDGRFRARVEGATTGNVLLRRRQYQVAEDAGLCLGIAKRFVAAKLHNGRVVLQHYARDYPEISEVLASAIDALRAEGIASRGASSLDELRGFEGDAAHAYFSIFGHLLRIPSDGAAFCGRSRRPPRDPVNACLSFFYTMLARDVVSGCESVGLDPQMGYLHACRPGRESLALDLIEELRAPYVDRFVLSLFNRKQIGEKDFRRDGDGGVFFTEAALKKVLGLWQAKKRESLMHPFLKERVELGLLPFIQPQLLARYLRGDLDGYPACMWR